MNIVVCHAVKLCITFINLYMFLNQQLIKNADSYLKNVQMLSEMLNTEQYSVDRRMIFNKKKATALVCDATPIQSRTSATSSLPDAKFKKKNEIQRQNFAANLLCVFFKRTNIPYQIAGGLRYSTATYVPFTA